MAKSKTLEQKIGENSFASRGFLKGNVLKKIQEVDELYQRDLYGKNLGLLDDDDIQKIGVLGTEGIGKTTIVKLVHNQLLKETERFDIVIWITVSKEMNIIKLQNRIARAMKVSLDEDEDETIRPGMIYEMLVRKGNCTECDGLPLAIVTIAAVWMVYVMVHALEGCTS
ncbi:probable disease resistance protein At1g61300 [Durio zibethinus]|uniref:Probable disease resistance protein At1g61300 n=1 Tax=Durio zibethinus TaxID=66656 RepID=A0A6P5Y589_DURZI|nr:probable disease resistance protein At1g61300 [Durio zibethinus]